MQQSYDGIAKTLHWVIMALLFQMLWYGLNADSIPKEEKLAFFQNHSGLGLILLTLMITRLVWRRFHPAPPLPADTPRWQQIASKATHHGLYALVILQPLLGLLLTTTSKGNLRPFGLFGLHIVENHLLHEIGETLHTINAWVITGLIALHVVAALYHHFIRRDNVLRRMLPFVKA
ncbi:MAG: cytochrome b [Parvibaculaceae bacterium]